MYFVILDYYDREVSQMISKKYGFPIMDAYKKFMFSKTYEMLSNPDLQMWDFNRFGLFCIKGEVSPQKSEELPRQRWTWVFRPAR